MAKKIGMVIINYNDYETTNRLLDNISSYKCLEKIVVVDNNSTDNSYTKLKKLSNNKILVIKNSKNSYASGLNFGAKRLVGEIGECNIIFSNSDVIIKEEKDLKTLSSNIKKDISVVGPVVLEHNDLNRGWKESKISYEILFNLPLISRYFYKKLLFYNNEYYKTDTSVVDVLSGCFFMVDSKVLKEVDYFDENTFLYYEELIFSKKIRNISKKLLIDNRVSIIHDHSVTIDKSYKKINKYKILKSSQRYYVKEYLKANCVQLLLLDITNKLSLIILYVRCFLGGMK